MKLSGIPDVDLLIVKHLGDGDIENLEKCIKVKKDSCFWKERMGNKYNIKIKNGIISKNNYLEYARFLEYFNLSLIKCLLKDYYENKFSLFHILKFRNVNYEGFYPLLNKIKDFLNECPDINYISFTSINPSSFGIFESYLIEKKSVLLNIEEEYDKIKYNYSFNVKIGETLCDNTFIGNLNFIIFTYLYRRKNMIFPYSVTIYESGLLEITFKDF